MADNSEPSDEEKARDCQLRSVMVAIGPCHDAGVEVFESWATRFACLGDANRASICLALSERSAVLAAGQQLH